MEKLNKYKKLISLSLMCAICATHAVRHRKNSLTNDRPAELPQVIHAWGANSVPQEVAPGSSSPASPFFANQLWFSAPLPYANPSHLVPQGMLGMPVPGAIEWWPAPQQYPVLHPAQAWPPVLQAQLDLESQEAVPGSSTSHATTSRRRRNRRQPNASQEDMSSPLAPSQPSFTFAPSRRGPVSQPLSQDELTAAVEAAGELAEFIPRTFESQKGGKPKMSGMVYGLLETMKVWNYRRATDCAANIIHKLKSLGNAVHDVRFRAHESVWVLHRDFYTDPKKMQTIVNQLPDSLTRIAKQIDSIMDSVNTDQELHLHFDIDKEAVEPLATTNKILGALREHKILTHEKVSLRIDSNGQTICQIEREGNLLKRYYVTANASELLAKYETRQISSLRSEIIGIIGVDLHDGLEVEGVILEPELVLLYKMGLLLPGGMVINEKNLADSLKRNSPVLVVTALLFCNDPLARSKEIIDLLKKIIRDELVSLEQTQQAAKSALRVRLLTNAIEMLDAYQKDKQEHPENRLPVGLNFINALLKPGFHGTRKVVSRLLDQIEKDFGPDVQSSEIERNIVDALRRAAQAPEKMEDEFDC